MGHVGRYVGGVKEDYKTVDQEGAVYTHAPKAKQKEAVQFLNNQLFNTPKWMLDNEILNRLQDDGAVTAMKSMQVRTLNSVLEPRKLGRVIENEALNGKDAYGMLELFSDVRNGIWSELSAGKAIDTYRRNLQSGYIDRMETLMKDNSQSDISSVARAELKTLQARIKAAIPRTSDRMSKIHLEDALEKVNNILDPK